MRDTLIIPVEFRSRDGSSQPITSLHCTCGFYGGEFRSHTDLDRMIVFAPITNPDTGRVWTPNPLPAISPKEWGNISWIIYPDYAECQGCGAMYPATLYDYPDGSRKDHR